MKKNTINNLKLITFVFIFGLFFGLKSYSANFYLEGKSLFDEKSYEESKFLFYRDIVFNPKNHNSYLYLAKIFKLEDDEERYEKYLNTVLVLVPKNEEALEALALFKVKKSDFKEAEKLNSRLKLVCTKKCPSVKKIEKDLLDAQQK